MAVRSGMRAYAQQHFANPQNSTAANPSEKSVDDVLQTMAIADVASSSRNISARERPATKDFGPFYQAIRDSLEFSWQVDFFPAYVELPVTLVEKIGTGLRQLDTVEKLRSLAQISLETISAAEARIGDAAAAKYMLQSNILAAESISAMSETEYAGLADSCRCSGGGQRRHLRQPSRPPCSWPRTSASRPRGSGAYPPTSPS